MRSRDELRGSVGCVCGWVRRRSASRPQIESHAHSYSCGRARAPVLPPAGGAGAPGGPARPAGPARARAGAAPRVSPAEKIYIYTRLLSSRHGSLLQYRFPQAILHSTNKAASPPVHIINETHHVTCTPPDGPGTTGFGARRHTFGICVRVCCCGGGCCSSVGRLAPARSPNHRAFMLSSLRILANRFASFVKNIAFIAM